MGFESKITVAAQDFLFFVASFISICCIFHKYLLNLKNYMLIEYDLNYTFIFIIMNSIVYTSIFFLKLLMSTQHSL
jgi:hypothetical protein